MKLTQAEVENILARAREAVRPAIERERRLEDQRPREIVLHT
jgi:hypothetical protein